MSPFDSHAIKAAAKIFVDSYHAHEGDFIIPGSRQYPDGSIGLDQAVNPSGHLSDWMCKMCRCNESDYENEQVLQTDEDITKKIGKALSAIFILSYDEHDPVSARLSYRFLKENPDVLKEYADHIEKNYPSDPKKIQFTCKLLRGDMQEKFEAMMKALGKTQLGAEYAQGLFVQSIGGKQSPAQRGDISSTPGPIP